MADLVRNDQALPDDKIKVKEWMASWMAERTDVRPSTRATWERVTAHITARLGRVRVVALRPVTVDAALADMPPGTARNARAVLAAALRDAMREGIVDRNVATLAKPLPAARHTQHVPTPEDVRALIAVKPAHRLGAMFTVALTTGLRLSELSGLRWADITGDSISVVRGLVWVNGTPAYQDPKTPSARRTVLLPAVAVSALAAHKVRQNVERVGNRRWQDNGLVFTNRDGEPVHPNSVRWVLDELCKAAGIVRFPMHSCRRFYATVVTSSSDLKTAAVSLGHRSESMTDVYARGTDEQRERARDILEEAIG
jgi:integrase